MLGPLVIPIMLGPLVIPIMLGLLVILVALGLLAIPIMLGLLVIPVALGLLVIPIMLGLLVILVALGLLVIPIMLGLLVGVALRGGCRRLDAERSGSQDRRHDRLYTALRHAFHTGIAFLDMICPAPRARPTATAFPKIHPELGRLGEPRRSQRNS